MDYITGLVSLSDPHLTDKQPVLRKDDYFKTAMEKFVQVLKFCEANNKILLIPGDLTDSPRSWAVLRELFFVLNEFPDVEIIVVPGQHDKYFRSDKSTTLDILKTAGYIKIAGEQPIILKTANGDEVFIYGAGWGDEIPPATRGFFNVLLIHAPLSVEEKNFETSSANKFFKDWSEFYNIILFGDIHQRIEIVRPNTNCFMINTGPLLRKEFSVEMRNHSPSFWVYDFETKANNFRSIRCNNFLDVFDEKTAIQEQNVNLARFVESLKENSMKTVRAESTLKENIRLYIRREKPQKPVRDKIYELIELLED